MLIITNFIENRLEIGLDLVPEEGSTVAVCHGLLDLARAFLGRLGTAIGKKAAKEKNSES